MDGPQHGAGSVDVDPVAGLPAFLTRFVGRSGELKDLGSALATSRLLTICGAGGLGKTRLAVEVAKRCSGAFVDGVVWVSLVGVTDAEAVNRAIGAAVLRRPASGMDPIGSAAAVIGDRRVLIVLDNCEQVSGPCAISVTRLLEGCPGLAVVATSRVALHVPTEQVYATPPLGVSRDGTADGDAVALFVDRARLGAPGWQVSVDVDAAVVQICHRLEGVPLAIELAASWVRVLSPQDLLAEIVAGVENLSGLGEVVALRHRSLQAVLESTWTWLGAADRDVLARLSVFVDGFTREAAEVVAGATLGTLATLSERALIGRVPQPTGATRYHVHELVRVFAGQRLRSQLRQEDTEHRHYAYFAGLVHVAEAAWDTRDEPQALAQIAADQGNVEAALTRAIARRAATEALRLAGGLFAYWIYTAPLEGRREFLDHALALPSDEAEDPAVRARALNVAGYAWLYADRRRAAELFGQGIDLYRRADDRPGEAWSVRGLAYVHLIWGELDTADRLNEESLRICRAVGDPAGVAWSLFDGAESAVARRDLDYAFPRLTEAFAAFTDLGIDYASYRTLILLGDVHRLERNWASALDHYRQALDLQRRRGFTTRGAEILEGLGSLATAVGRADLTARLQGAATTWRQALGTARLGYNEADVDAARAAAQHRLTGSEWLHQFGHGERLGFDEAQVETEKAIRDLTAWCTATDTNLTRREVDVLGLIAEGLSNPEIADRLVLSRRTVHAHVRSIFVKLDVTSRTAAALKARELAIGPPHKVGAN